MQTVDFGWKRHVSVGWLIVVNVPLVWDVDNGGNHVCVEATDKWEISELSAQFCCKAKITLKKLSLFFF